MKLCNMKFYKRLVEREVMANVRQKEKNDISGIRESSHDSSLISRPEEVMGMLEDEVDEYESERDLGYEVYRFPSDRLSEACK